jgi:hypothetical protein
VNGVRGRAPGPRRRPIGCRIRKFSESRPHAGGSNREYRSSSGRHRHARAAGGGGRPGLRRPGSRPVVGVSMGTKPRCYASWLSRVGTVPAGRLPHGGRRWEPGPRAGASSRGVAPGAEERCRWVRSRPPRLAGALARWAGASPSAMVSATWDYRSCHEWCAGLVSRGRLLLGSRPANRPARGPDQGERPASAAAALGRTPRPAGPRPPPRQQPANHDRSATTADYRLPVCSAKHERRKAERPGRPRAPPAAPPR